MEVAGSEPRADLCGHVAGSRPVNYCGSGPVADGLPDNERPLQILGVERHLKRAGKQSLSGPSVVPLRIWPEGLPDPDPILRRPVHAVPRLNVERLMEGVGVREHPDHPELAR